MVEDVKLRMLKNPSMTSRQQSRIKETKNTNSKNKIVFCSKYDPMGPNIKNIIRKHAPILNNCQVIQSKEIMVEYKHKKN